MKLKNVLIVVKDIEKARQFCHDLSGLTMKSSAQSGRNTHNTPV